MKIVIAIIKPFKLDECVKLIGAGIEGVTQSGVRGLDDKGQTSAEYGVNFLPKVRQSFLPTTSGCCL